MTVTATTATATIPCPVCKGTGVKDITYGQHGLPRDQRTRPCVACDATGGLTVTAAAAAQYAARILQLADSANLG